MFSFSIDQKNGASLLRTVRIANVSADLIVRFSEQPSSENDVLLELSDGLITYELLLPFNKMRQLLRTANERLERLREANSLRFAAETD